MIVYVQEAANTNTEPIPTVGQIEKNWPRVTDSACNTCYTGEVRRQIWAHRIEKTDAGENPMACAVGPASFFLPDALLPLFPFLGALPARAISLTKRNRMPHRSRILRSVMPAVSTVLLLGGAFAQDASTGALRGTVV